MQFLSKAKTLEYLSKKLKTVFVPNIIILMLENTINIKKKLSKKFKKLREKLQLDLPQFYEDSENKSMAGYFLSELNVKIDNSELLKKH